ncbi:MAG: PDZ domain-containing protein [Oligoflexia bacterium]|nr:PDZ domain-containing protein [Oligoflexia bacterium]
MRKLLVVLAIVLGAGCSTSPTKKHSFLTNGAKDSPGMAPPSVPLRPKGQPYSGDGLPIIQNVAPKSIAQKAGLQKGDRIVKLNGSLTFSAKEVERKIKTALGKTSLEISRAGKPHRVTLNLTGNSPKLGIAFEPSDRVIVKPSTPIIGILHKESSSIFAKASATKDNKLRISLIIQGSNPRVGIPLRVDVFESRGKRVIGSYIDTIDALGLDPLVVSQDFKRPNQDLALPVLVRVSLANEKFLFEFQ